MNKNCAFTICAKNYLAQAMTLEQSFKKHNPGVDFYIFLADSPNNLSELPPLLRALSNEWCPKWEEMAFKYNVIEFATSIKPFCFKLLFSEEYDKVVYLDPDIYVTRSLHGIYDILDNKSIVLTPHYNHIQTNYTGAVTEEELLFVGIYNLGFCGIANNLIGNAIVDWWCNRLENKCYADHDDALHVDQRWIDFIPGFFPNDCYISHHPGMNVAIWNLHERQLQIDGNGEYIIKDLVTKESEPLLFFHFSGFDPGNIKLINRRHPHYNVDTYPSFAPIIESYSTLVLSNGYEKYHAMKYDFNSFDNGVNITPLMRRIFRSELKNSRIYCKNIFSSDSAFYKLLRKNNLVDKTAFGINGGVTDSDREKGSRVESKLHSLSRVFIRLFGIKRYYLLLRMMRKYSRLENQSFLID